MAEIDDVMSTIVGMKEAYKASEVALRASIDAISEHVASICLACATHYSGTTFSFEWCGPDERVYGHLFCSESGLSIAHRSTMDDVAMNEPGIYTVMVASKWPTGWLREIAKAEHIQKFMRGFASHLRQLANETQVEAKLIGDIANAPSSSIAQAFELAAEAIGYHRAIRDWREAQAAVEVNPERSITLACTLLETVCKHALDDLGEPTPADQSIVPLFKATSKALGLDPSNQVEPELRGLCGGLATVTQNIGALRTKSGDAHGKNASYTALTSSHARLATNTAGAAATFLMEQVAARPKKPK